MVLSEHSRTSLVHLAYSPIMHKNLRIKMYCLHAVAVCAALMTPLVSVAATPQIPSQPQVSCAGHALSGTVQDSTAAVIPGATLQIDGTAGQSQTSGGDGRFTFPCISAGTHQLSVSAPGFAPSQQELPARSPTDFRITLVPSESVSIDVEVDTPASDPILGGLNGTTLSGTQLNLLADDPDDLQRELQQLAAAAGGPPSGTVLSVDGFQDDSPLPPKSSIARIQVNPDLFSAENRQPPFEGGHIEIFTKPGAKNFHGSLFTTNSSQWMNSRDPFSDAPASIGKQRYGFTLNGPVRKQGSNFSLALEHRSIDEFAVVNAVTLDSAGNQTSTVANVPVPQRLWIGSARVDAQLGPKNIAFVSYSANVNDLSNVGAGGTTLLENGYDSERHDHILRFSDTTTLSPTLLHESRLSIDFRGEDDTPNSLAPQVQVAGAFTGGGADIGKQRIHQIRTEWDDDFILTHGKHSLKAGLQLFDFVERQTLTTNFNGAYTFGGGNAPVLDANNNATSNIEVITGLEQYRRTLLHLPGGTPTQYSSVTGNPQVNFTEFYPVVYAQDDIKLIPNLTLSVGLRYFFANHPFQNDGLTPRLGVSWAPGGSKTLTLNAHLGLFSGHSPNGLQGTKAELLREDGTTRVTSLVYNPVYGAPDITGSSVIHALRTVAPNYNSNQDIMAQVGAEKTLPFGFNLSTNFIYVRSWHQERTLNVNAPLDNSPTGPRPGAPNLNVLQLQSSADGAGDIEFVGIGNQKFKRLQFFVGAVRIHILTDANDDAFFNPQSSATNKGEYSRETGDSLWQNFSNVTLNLPRKIVVTTNYYGNGNSPFDITTGGDNNGDGNFNDRPQFALPGQSGTVTPFGTLVASGGTGVLSRNVASLPWSFHVDGNVQRVFNLTRNSKADHQQTLTANIRSSNLLNHTNITAEGGVLGSPLFLVPYSADNSRRVEGGLRYSF
jgi:Carboxypeptidase regulatory-like domain